jgi:hypothetical protein
VLDRAHGHQRGQIQAIFATLPTALPHIKTGKAIFTTCVHPSSPAPLW